MKSRVLNLTSKIIADRPYSRYYKPPLYLFLRLFGAASIQEFVHFPSFSTVELHFGAASIQERLLFKSVL